MIQKDVLKVVFAENKNKLKIICKNGSITYSWCRSTDSHPTVNENSTFLLPTDEQKLWRWLLQVTLG